MPRLHDVRLSLVQRAPAVHPALLHQRRGALLVDTLPVFVGFLIPHDESARRGSVDLRQREREGRQVVVEDVPEAREQVDEERGDALLVGEARAPDLEDAQRALRLDAPDAPSPPAA